MLALRIRLAIGIAVASSALDPGAIAAAQGADKDSTAAIPALDDGEILGFVALSGAQPVARRLSEFYGALLDASPRLAPESTFLARIELDHRLLAQHQVAIDAELGTVFIARDDGAVERVEFGVPTAAAGADLHRAGRHVFAATDDAEATALEAYVGALDFGKGATRVDVRARVDLATGRDTWVPTLLAFGAVARGFGDPDDPALRLFERALRVVSVVTEQVDSIDVSGTFGVSGARFAARAAWREGSAFARTVERAFAIEPLPLALGGPDAAMAGSPGGSGGLVNAVAFARLGLGLDALLEPFGGEAAGAGGNAQREPGSVEDASPAATTVAWFAARDSIGCVLAGAGGSAVVARVERLAKALGAVTARSSAGVAVGLGDVAPERGFAVVEAIPPGEPGSWDPFATEPSLAPTIGIGRVSLPALRAAVFPDPNGAVATGTAATSSWTLIREVGSVDLRIDLPLGELQAWIPRVNLRGS